MSMILSEDLSLLRDSARDFLSREAPVAHMRRLRDRADPLGLSPELWKKFGYMGFAGLPLAEAFGGSGLGHAATAVVMEEIGRHLTPSPFLASSVVCSRMLARGTEVQQRGCLPFIASGDSIAALAIDETARHGPPHTALAARAVASGFELDGTKTFVVDGQAADLLIVVARTGGDRGDTRGLTAFVLAAKHPGVAIERVALLDGRCAARVRFDAAQLEEGAILGELHGGWDVLSPALAAGRLAVAAELIGVAQQAFDLTLAFLKERVQFGRRIGEFQALQHRAVRAWGEIEMARAAVMKAAQLLDLGDAAPGGRAGHAVSVAKAKAGAAATLAVQEAAQMHGGMGMTDDIDVGLFLKRARVLDELFGDTRWHAGRVAELSGY